MSGLDIFAWIVLIIPGAGAIGVLRIAGWLPGAHREDKLSVFHGVTMRLS